MPLKKKKTVQVTSNPNPVVEGPVIQTVTGAPMSLFESVAFPMVTLNANQFNWPKTLLVMSVRRRELNVKNPETGWDAKDENKQKTGTGEFYTSLRVVNGDLAQTLVDAGQLVDGLTSVQVDIMQDIPGQKFVPGETLIELVKPVVMLGFGNQSADRIVIKAEGYKEV